MAARMKFLEAIVPGFLWLWLFWHLHDEWSLNAQYNYGWAVPFLGAFLFYLRWLDRPAPEPAPRPRAASAIGWMLLALMLPVRMIEEANPDWRLLGWIFALAVVGYSLLALQRAGGRAWVNHFAFPVCFPLVAVPWLVQLENSVVQRLTGTVAYAAVEIAGWIGVGAYQLGNVIELHNGFVGVDEACSGVKTLQAAIMVTLLLGELLSLPVARRGALILAGCIWVFAGNVLRATALVIIAANQGTEALSHWHDPIGTLVVVIGMAGLGAIAWFIRVEKGNQRSEPRLAVPAKFQGSMPGIFLRLGWLVLIFVGTEMWYRGHERKLLTLPAWQVRWPANVALQPAPIADSTRAILQYNRASSAAWEHPAGIHWWSFFARWEPQRTAVQLVRSHSPEICLPATGRTFRGERPPVLVETSVAPLRFRAYEFEQQGRALFVFVCVQEDKVARDVDPVSPRDDWSAGGRLRAVWRGQRNLGQRLLEIAVIGFDDFGQASASFAETVRAMIEATASTG